MGVWLNQSSNFSNSLGAFQAVFVSEIQGQSQVVEDMSFLDWALFSSCVWDDSKDNSVGHARTEAIHVLKRLIKNYK